MTPIVLILLLLFQLKHFIFDFYYQPPYMLNNKGTYGHLGGILHSGLHALATFPILLLVVNPAFAFWLSVAEFLLHYHIDWVKMNVNKEFQLTPAKVQFWQLTGLDQYLHQLTYIGLLTISVWGHI